MPDLTPSSGISGTARIATAGGAVHARHLRPGDLLRTVDGRLVPVASTHAAMGRNDRPPVLMRRQAIDRYRPARDLLLAPDQTVVANGCALPASMLLNGLSIREAPGGTARALLLIATREAAIVPVDDVPIRLAAAGDPDPDPVDLAAAAALWSRLAERATRLAFLFPDLHEADRAS